MTVSVLLHGLALGALAWSAGLRPTAVHARDSQPRRSVTLTASAPEPEAFAPDLDPEDLSFEARLDAPEVPVESFDEAALDLEGEPGTEAEDGPETDDLAEAAMDFVPRPQGTPKDLTQRTPVALPDPARTEPAPADEADPDQPLEVATEQVVEAEAPPSPTSAIPITTSCPHPEYPPQAVRMNWQGKVVVLLDVRTDGTVSDVRVIQGSGRKVLDRAVVEAVQDWTLEPATRAGVAVRSELELTFRFDATGVHTDRP